MISDFRKKWRRADGRKVLIVEDDNDARLILDKRLSRIGFEVRGVATARDATRLAKNWAPDLMMLDVRLPDCDGFELAHRFRSENDIKSIPIIFLSGKIDGQFKHLCDAVGNCYFIRKPYDPELLSRLVTSIVADSPAPVRQF